MHEIPFSGKRAGKSPHAIGVQAKGHIATHSIGPRDTRTLQKMREI